MHDLIMALVIFSKYANNTHAPTHCEHDILRIYAGIELIDISMEDSVKLTELGFYWSEEDECFYSYRFGSC